MMEGHQAHPQDPYVTYLASWMVPVQDLFQTFHGRLLEELELFAPSLQGIRGLTPIEHGWDLLPLPQLAGPFLQAFVFSFDQIDPCQLDASWR